MVFIDGFKQGIWYENVGFWIKTYESAFEKLTQLVADKWSLSVAILVDKGECIHLPIEAFDGQPIQAQIEALEQEWTQLLEAKPQ